MTCSLSLSFLLREVLQRAALFKAFASEIKSASIQGFRHKFCVIQDGAESSTVIPELASRASPN